MFTVSSAYATAYSEIRSYVKTIITESDLNPASTISGSGIVISPGYILTVGHVIPEGSDKFSIYTINRESGGITKLKILKIDRELDLALLVGDIPCPCATLSKKKVYIDETVYSVGFPLYTSYHTQFVSTGIIQEIKIGALITSLSSMPGSSGGGVFINEDGYELIGVVMAVGIYGKEAQQQLIGWMTFISGPTQIRSFLANTHLSNL
jgi:V8-like Glu-specific endopeptidase